MPEVIATRTGRGKGTLGASEARRIGIALDFLPLDPIEALYWSAVINGVVAAPFMAVVMILADQKKVMGPFVIKGWLYWLGWASTVAMTTCVAGMVIGLMRGHSQPLPQRNFAGARGLLHSVWLLKIFWEQSNGKETQT
jgi:hypothetical protein